MVQTNESPEMKSIAMKETSNLSGFSSLILTIIVWSAILTVPLVLSPPQVYRNVFPSGWYDEVPRVFPKGSEWPSPVGLTLGILAVMVGQIFVLIYFSLRKLNHLGTLKPIQTIGAPSYELWEGITTHLAQPEGFIMLGGYLIGTWMFGLMPSSYYSFSGGVNWLHVILQLLTQDIIQTFMHFAEHKISPELYRLSHKPHHRFTNPRLFDAFNGSIADTFFMILVPLYLTAHCVPANVWSYMAFGSLYANWLTLIHAEYVHPWDPVFRFLGFGTAADHHVHHKLFIFNYGHLFMYWDKLMGTYRDPRKVGVFNKNV